MKKFLFITLLIGLTAFSVIGQETKSDDDAKIDAIVERAVKKLGGAKYLSSTKILSKGKFSLIQKQKIMSFQSFVDFMDYPNRERTDFKERGSKTIQVNTGDTGWIYEEHLERFGPQPEPQINGFKKSIRTHYDFLLRGIWKDLAEATFIGRRPASLGKRNDVVRLSFEDDSWIEYEFSDEGLPMKVLYPGVNSEGAIINEENRYAQYLLTEGIYYPFVVDHYVEDVRTYRINYIEVSFGRTMPDSIFEKPENPKKIRKLKF